MLYSPKTFYHQVVEPTLSELNIENTELSRMLTAIALCPDHRNPDGIGVYQITQTQHRDLWDNFLCRDPELASLVRGLASQHRFLQNPELELALNPGYATAIASYMFAQSSISLSGATADQLRDSWCHLSSMPGDLVHSYYYQLCEQLAQPAA